MPWPARLDSVRAGLGPIGSDPTLRFSFWPYDSKPPGETELQVVLHPHELVPAEKAAPDLGEPEFSVERERWYPGRGRIQYKRAESVLCRKCHQFTHQGGGDTASAPLGIDSQPSYLTDLRTTQPTARFGDAAVFCGVGIGGFGMTYGSECNAADDVLLYADT